MIEEAQKILEYFPIRYNEVEYEYIEHLWRAFTTLVDGEEKGRSFSIMPFHLLFMLALQYKVLRIAKTQTKSSNLFFSGVGSRSKRQLLSENRSVFDMALINERTIPEIFQLIDLDPVVIKNIKNLVDNRNNNLAHAQGGIERKLDEKINKYIQAIEEVQKSIIHLNKDVSINWLYDMRACEDIDQYLESNFLISGLTRSDFGDIMEDLFKAEQVNSEQWQQLVDKGFELSRDKTIIALRNIAKDGSFSEEKRFNVMQALFEQGEVNDEVDIPRNTNIMDLLQLNNQQKTELRAARIYIKNKEYNDHFINFIIEKQNSNTDVIYKPKNLKFQVVSVDGSPYKLLKNGTYEYSFSAIDTCRIYIEEPIVKKNLKYAGRGVDDVILLIHSLNKPLTDKIWDQIIQDNQSSIKDLAQKSGFKEICLCFDSKGEIIKLY